MGTQSKNISVETDCLDSPTPGQFEFNTEMHSVYAVEPRPSNCYKTEFPDLTQFIKKMNKSGRKLRVCIAAEDIVGPVRNGGIGTTYTHLSKMLTKAEHEVVIAYLRGNHCQNKSMPYWIDWYKSFGITFIPIDPNTINLQTAAPQWMRPMYALYEFLKMEHFDLVHVSEWRGSSYISLLAKKQGLAFQDTVFCVKASSPWLWNREHGYHTIQRLDDLPKMYAEKCSIELADFVIGGSRYLLRWMIDNGYKLPAGRCYVQPNVVFPLDLDSKANHRRKMTGQRIPIEEIVFFGRLEYRKGLDLFFKALHRLNDQHIQIPKITLMGKFGERIPTHADLSIPEYINMQARRLSKNVQILSNLDNEKALLYLLSGNRLAVMPSRIENSTLAVYEAGHYGIPCVASDVGGTSELIAPEHHEMVLAAPDPIALSKKIAEALSEGGFIPMPSFSNDQNLDIWNKFHGAMAAYVDDLPHSTVKVFGHGLPRLTICLVVNDDHEYTQEVLSRISNKIDGINAEAIIINSESTRTDTIAWVNQLKNDASDAVLVVNSVGFDEQQAWNQAVTLATGELLLFMEAGTLIKPEAIDTLRNVAAFSDADVFGCYYDLVEQADDIDSGKCRICGVLTGDLSSAFFDLSASSPLIAVRKHAIQALGGFRDDYEIPGALGEFISKAKLHNYTVEAIPESLVWFVKAFSNKRSTYKKAAAYRSIRPFFESAPHCFKKIFLAAKGFGYGNQFYASHNLNSITFGGGGILSDPLLALEEKVRKVAHITGSSPKMRSLGSIIYHLNITIFRKILLFQIKVFNMIVIIKNKISRK